MKRYLPLIVGAGLIVWLLWRAFPKTIRAREPENFNL